MQANNQSSSKLIHYKSKSDYQKGIKGTAEKSQEVKEEAEKAVKAVKKVADVAETAAKASISSDAVALASAGKKLAVDAVTTIAKSAAGAQTPQESSEAQELKEALDAKLPINKPGIYFLEGLHLSTLNSKAGLEDIAKSFSNADFVSWQDEDQVFDEILRRPKEEPIILVGHSLGGDAVVNLANRLNSIEGGFRKVDLLVTLDSIGFDNDIIPANVGKNLNYILDRSYIFNDGPNIARNHSKTDVVNILRSEGHTEIDESSEVHREIHKEITSVLDENFLIKRKRELISLFKAFRSPVESSQLTKITS